MGTSGANNGAGRGINGRSYLFSYSERTFCLKVDNLHRNGKRVQEIGSLVEP